jgi:hypothetical protein
MRNIFFVGLMLFAFIANSQNDDCITAISISSSTNGICNPVFGDSFGATQSAEPSCTGNNDDDVWYSFIASSTTCSLSVQGSLNYDAVVETFTGSCGALTSIKCIDDVGASSTESIHFTGLSIGNTYYFRVFDYYTNPATTTFTICLFNTTPPTNDNCGNTINIPVTSNCNSPIAGTSFQASESLNAISCSGNNDDDVWYRFTATSTANYIYVNCSSGYDAVIQAFTGSCWTNTVISCSDNVGAGGLEYAHLTNLTPGQSYFFRVYDYQQGSGSDTFSVCVVDAPPPVNDECVGAININSSLSCSNSYTGTSQFATQSSITSCSGTNLDDVWYKFTAVGLTQTLSVSGDANFDAIVEVFDGNCSNLNSIQCIDNAGAGGTEDFVFGSLIAGNTYYFRVHNYYYTPSSSTEFTICLQHGYTPPPTNDDCLNAINLPVTSPCTQTLTSGTSLNATQSMNGCWGNADDDVWYKFTATNADLKIDVTPGNGMDAVLQLFDGTCGTLNHIDCVNNNGTNGITTIAATGLLIGQTYYVRVYDYGSNVGYPFTISVYTNEVKLNTTKNEMCLGGNVNISVTGANSYTWSTGANTSSITVNPTVTTTYSVAATSTGSCLFTDSVTIEVATPVTPEICLISTDSLGQNNEIYWEKSQYNNVDSFIVYREVTTGVFNRIGAVSNNAYSMYLDTNRSIGPANGDPEISSYKYKLQIRDTCGNYGALSLWHENIHMQDMQNGTFNWNSYGIESSPSPVSLYECLKVNLTTGTQTLVTSSAGNTYVDPNYNTTWQTNIKWFISGPGFNCNSTARVQAQKVKTKSNHANDKVIATNINKNTDLIDVKIYPNPANSVLNIEVSASTNSTKDLNIKIMDVLGKEVLATEYQKQIDISHLSKGIYFVKITSGKNSSDTKKLVVE